MTHNPGMSLNISGPKEVAQKPIWVREQRPEAF